MRLPTRFATLFAKHWFPEIDGPVVSMTPLLFVWELSVKRTYWRCSSERPDILPKRALLGMHVVSLPDKPRSIGESAIDQDIYGDAQMRSFGKMAFTTREVKGEAL
jgi:hypothetical protein